MRLAIDTSGPLMSVALGDVSTVKILKTSSAGGKVCEELPGLVAEALREVGVAEKDITEIVVGRGPGSFTGVRTGVALALGFATGLKVPIYGAGVLMALAASVKSSAAIVAFRKASLNENFVVAYKGEREILAPTALSIEGFEAAVAEKIGEANAQFCELASDVPASGLLCALSTKLLSSDLNPIYIKAVNARTLVERGLKPA